MHTTNVGSTLQPDVQYTNSHVPFRIFFVKVENDSEVRIFWNLLVDIYVQVRENSNKIKTFKYCTPAL